jgi:hypothetical protein
VLRKAWEDAPDEPASPGSKGNCRSAGIPAPTPCRASAPSAMPASSWLLLLATTQQGFQDLAGGSIARGSRNLPRVHQVNAAGYRDYLAHMDNEIST